MTKFGVEAEEVMIGDATVVLPVEPEVWLHSLTNQARKVITESNVLCEYIRELIKHIRENPGLINKNYTGTGVPVVQTDYLTAAKRKMFVYPSGKDGRKFGAELLYNMTPVVAGLGYMGGGGCPTNVRLSMGGMAPNGSMSGGSMSRGNVACASSYRQQYEGLKAQLRNGGFKVNAAQDATITAELERVEKNEHKFGQVFDILNALLEIKHLYGIPDHHGRPLEEIDVTKISTANGFNNYVNRNIPELTNYLSQNNVAQVAAINHIQRLVANVYGVAYGVSAPSVRWEADNHTSSRNVNLNQNL